MVELNEDEKLRRVKEAAELCFPILYLTLTEIEAPNYITADFECNQGRFRIRFERVKDE